MEANAHTPAHASLDIWLATRYRWCAVTLSSQLPEPEAVRFRLFQNLILLCLILLVPVIPFLLFGDQLEPWIESKLDSALWETNPFYTGFFVVAWLVADIFLPVPSSNVCTFAGKALGGGWGAFVCWLGLSLSCGLGYYLASWFGWPLARRLSSEETLLQMQAQANRFGMGTLVLFRAVPVLAEASVLLMGCSRLAAHRFWPPVLLANLGLAVAYAYLGEFAAAQGWFGLAMAIAFAAPAGLIVAWWLWHRGTGGKG